MFCVTGARQQMAFHCAVLGGHIHSLIGLTFQGRNNDLSIQIQLHVFWSNLPPLAASQLCALTGNGDLVPHCMTCKAMRKVSFWQVTVIVDGSRPWATSQSNTWQRRSHSGCVHVQKFCAWCHWSTPMCMPMTRMRGTPWICNWAERWKGVHPNALNLSKT